MIPSILSNVLFRESSWQKILSRVGVRCIDMIGLMFWAKAGSKPAQDRHGIVREATPLGDIRSLPLYGTGDQDCASCQVEHWSSGDFGLCSRRQMGILKASGWPKSWSSRQEPRAALRSQGLPCQRPLVKAFHAMSIGLAS